MRIKKTAAAVLALTLGLASLAQAQPYGGHDDRRGGPQGYQNHQPNRGDHGLPGPDRNMHDMRGAGPEHSFHRGDRLPPQYRSRQYVVDDWRGHRLSAPPRGYRWVQVGGDYVLAAIATGVIASLILNQ